MCPCISFRGFVRPSVCNAFVKFVVFHLFFPADQIFSKSYCSNIFCHPRRFSRLLLPPSPAPPPPLLTQSDRHIVFHLFSLPIKSVVNWDSGRLQGFGPPPGTQAAPRDPGHLQGLGPLPGTRAASRDSGRLQGLVPPPGTRAASRDLGRLQGHGLSPGTQAASRD